MKLMNSWRAALAALTITVAGLGVAGTAAAQDGATHVAVANPSRILAAMQETKDRNATDYNERQNLDAQEKAKVKEIDDLKGNRDKFTKKGTPDYDKQSNDILQKSVELQVWVEMQKAQLTRKHKEEIKGLFEKIQTTIAQISQERKIDLVVADYGVDLDDVDNLNPDQLHALLRQKSVLFAGKGVDITDDVIARLNAAYKAAPAVGAANSGK